MRKTLTVSFFLIFLCGLIVNSFAIEQYNTVYFDGKMPIVIDGDLTDWEEISILSVPIPFYQSLTSVESVPHAGDLSASFKCFADADYVYVAVTVEDDKVIVGNHQFGEGWNDDSVEICFDGDLNNKSKSYFDINDGQIRVTPQSDGKSYIEGVVPYLYISQLPYYWEARGIRGEFEKNENGYTVEVAIPLDILELDEEAENKTIGLNVRILEDDNELNDGLCEGVLSWSYDPDKTSWWKTDFYNRISFIRTETVTVNKIGDSGSGSTTMEVISTDPWELKLGLNAPDSKGFNEVLSSIFTDFSRSDWNSATQKIEPIKDRLWAELLLGVVQLHNDKYTEGIDIFRDFVQKCPDEYAKSWAEAYPYQLSRELLMSGELYERFQKREINKAILIMHELLIHNASNQDYRDLLIFAIRKTYGRDLDEDAIQRVINESVDDEIRNHAYIALARIYFIENRFGEAKNICNMLLNNNVGSDLELDAKMVLLSVDRKLIQ